MKNQQLRGRRVAVLATDGFEKVELVVPVKALRASGADVDVISLRGGSIRGVVHHEPASRVEVTKTVEESDAADYDALLVPGGLANPDALRQSAEARDFVRGFDRNDKPIATICHGPWVLASAGLLEGRVMTSWPGIRDDVINAGATWLDEPVVEDGNLVTSRGPQDIVPFVGALMTHFARGASMRRHGRTAASAPQRDAPPEAKQSSAKWRNAFLLGGVAIGLFRFVKARKQRPSPADIRAA